MNKTITCPKSETPLVSAGADFSCNKTCNQYLNVSDFHAKSSEKKTRCAQALSLRSLKPVLSLLSYLVAAVKGTSE